MLCLYTVYVYNICKGFYIRMIGQFKVQQNMFWQYITRLRRTIRTFFFFLKKVVFYKII